ncbi:glycosyltransferase family 39 protein [Pseudoclavibacter alba]|uniref:glycosyltransferase family 39 protein n=1 Tax=Pseudoclavibacter albus TaxID=272241 RepID=UPI0019D11660|nr:glycosyltransferase family 39 protein [Pseudoclavibacter alba]MBN6777597.1 glycosyltransferase family 39 protein [Pseudoclavibacter alba]
MSSSERLPGARSLTLRIPDSVSKHGDVIWRVLLVLLAVVWVGANVFFHGGILSVYDEWVYVDYLDKLPEQPFVKQGETIGPWAGGLMSCFGIERTGPIGAPCGGDYSNPLDYPQAGVSGAAAYPPVFFWVTWAVSRVFAIVPGVDELGAFRLTGMVWLIPTVLVLYQLIRYLSVSRFTAFCLSALFIVTPFSWWSYTFVSTDAPVAGLGALSLLLALRALRDEGSLWPLVVVSFAGGLVKLTPVFGLGLAVLVLLVRRWRGETELSWRRVLVGSGASVLALVVPQAAWMVFAKVTAVGAPPDQGILLPRSSLPVAIQETITLFLDDTVPVRSQMEIYAITETLTFFLHAIIVVGVIGTALLAARGTEERAIGMLTLIAALVFGPVLMLSLAVIGSAFPLPARYGAGLVPAFFLCAGLFAQRATTRWPFALVSLVTVAFQLVRIPASA